MDPDGSPRRLLELREMCWNSQQLWYRNGEQIYRYLYIYKYIYIYIDYKCSACLKKDWKILQIKIIDLVGPFNKESVFFQKKQQRICKGKWMPYTVTPKAAQFSWNFKNFCSRKSSSLLPLLRLVNLNLFSVKKSWAQKMASKKSHRVRKGVLPKAS